MSLYKCSAVSSLTVCCFVAYKNLKFNYTVGWSGSVAAGSESSFRVGSHMPLSKHINPSPLHHVPAQRITERKIAESPLRDISTIDKPLIIINSVIFSSTNNGESTAKRGC